MAYFRKRGDGWRAEIQRRGVRLSQDGFATKGLAKAWAADREAEIRAGVRGGIAGNHTLADALERYRDDVAPGHAGERWEVVRLNFFLRHLGGVGELIDRTAPDMIGKYRDARLRGELRDKRGTPIEAVQGATVRRELVLLSAVFEHAKGEWRWCANNPVKAVRKPPKSPDRQYLITPALELIALAALGYVDGLRPANSTQYVGAAFALAIETGMRAGELLGLRPADVDLYARVAHLPKTKNGDARDVPLSGRAVKILRGLGYEKNAARVFPISNDSRDALFRKVRDRTPELTGMNFHDSRHAACTRLSKKLNVLDLARMIGHRDVNSLLIYYRTTASEIAAQLDAVPA